MSEHVYNTEFYDYIDEGSRTSARIIANVLRAEMKIASLLDVGGGHGAWGAEWLAAGVADLQIVDGAYVDRRRLAVPHDRFLAHDLLQPLVLDRKFDLVQSLEVAEHLPADRAASFVRSLVAHGDVILFSAAVPFQGGEHHVNEQPPEYWRKLFGHHGYAAFDYIRPAIAGNNSVKPWYRFNTLVYANQAGEQRLSEAMRASRVADTQAVAIAGNLSWSARRAVVRLMPATLVKAIAMKKAALEAGFKASRK